MKAKITKSEYLQLLGLKTLAIQCNSKLDDLFESARKILEDDEACGWTSDLIYDDNTTLDHVLDVNNIIKEKI